MNRSMRKRAAFTLIELSITMGAGGTLMLLAIGLIHQTMTLSSMGRDRCDHQRTANRLATQFRRDVHRSEQCIIEAADGIELILPADQRIVYQAEANRITRLQPARDEVTRREVFALDQRSSISFELVEQPARAVVTILHHSPATAEQPRLDRRVSALIGRLTAHQRGELTNPEPTA